MNKNHKGIFCLNRQYSTTCMAIRERPGIETVPFSRFQTQLFLPPHPCRRGEGGLRTRGYFKKSFEDRPLISILTAVLNGHKHLEQTIQSVLNQSYDNVEYIIIDGGSTDNGIEIIRKYEHAIDYWVSEPDKGIYDAMNKGLDVTSGEWVHFLGCGDVFYSRDVLKSIFLNSKDLRHPVILVGNIIYDDDTLFVGQYSPRLYYKNTVHHQGAFYRRTVFREFRYQEDYSVSGDYALNLMLFCQQKSHLDVKGIIAKCDKRGISKQTKLSGYVEEIRIRHACLGRIKSLKYDVMTVARYLIKRCVKRVLLRK